MKSLWEVVERDVRRRELEDRKRVLHRVRVSLNFHVVSIPQPLGFTGVAGKPVTPPPPQRGNLNPPTPTGSEKEVGSSS